MIEMKNYLNLSSIPMNWMGAIIWYGDVNKLSDIIKEEIRYQLKVKVRIKDWIPHY